MASSTPPAKPPGGSLHHEASMFISSSYFMGPSSLAAVAASLLGAPQGFSLLANAPSTPGPSWRFAVECAFRDRSSPFASALTAAGTRLAGGSWLQPCGSCIWAASPTLWWSLYGNANMPATASRRQVVSTAVQLVEMEKLVLERGASNQQPQDPPCAPDLAALRRAAHGMASSMSASQSGAAIRLLGFVLTLAWRALFGGRLLVDAPGLARVWEKAKEADSTLVYLPTHKSHTDYLLLSYVLYSVGLMSPMVAAGSNLNVPLVGRLCRWFGAFYIHRGGRKENESSDADLYRMVQRAYLQALVMHEQPVELFLEAGRTRDGRIAPPRLGLLSALVDAELYLDLPKPLVLVPVSISYDVPFEEQAMVKQLMGAPKKPESLMGFLNAIYGMIRLMLPGSKPGASHGMAIVSFGEPQDIRQYFEEHFAKYRRNRKKKATSLARKASGGGANEGSKAGDAANGGVDPEEAKAGIAPLTNGSQQQQPIQVDMATAIPRNGEVRRRIIDKIGFAVSSQLRESSVIPQLALVAAATAMPDFEGSASFGFGQPHADGAALQPWIAWQSVQEVERRVEWLVSELRWRGYKSVSLRPLGGTAREAREALVQAARILPGCLEVKTSETANKGAMHKIRLAPGAESRCMLQSRLHYLLPAFAAEGLVVAALSAETSQRNQPSPASVQGKRSAEGGSPNRRNLKNLMPMKRDTSFAPVPEEQVIKSALWLRNLMSAELDCHLGEGQLQDEASFAAVVKRMVEEGALMSVRVSNRGGSTRGLLLAPPSPSQRSALLAGWLLAPLCAMHTFALLKCTKVLSAAGNTSAPMEDLLEAMKIEMQNVGKQGAHPAPPVANAVMAGNALVGLCRAGIFVSQAASEAENGKAKSGTKALQHAPSNWDLVQPKPSSPTSIEQSSSASSMMWPCHSPVGVTLALAHPPHDGEQPSANGRPPHGPHQKLAARITSFAVGC